MSWRVTEQQKKNAPPFAHMLGGGLGGICGVTITSPLEVIKTRLQAKNNSEHLINKKSPIGTRTISAIVLDFLIFINFKF